MARYGKGKKRRQRGPKGAGKVPAPRSSQKGRKAGSGASPQKPAERAARGKKGAGGKASVPLRVLQVVLEARSPFLLATGEDEGYLDAGPVRDPHGLPTLPGTALAGALREALHRRLAAKADPRTAQRVEEYAFGPRPGAEKEEQRGSRVRLSWGHVHDASDRPVDGFDPARDIQSDPVLALAARGIERHRVRLNARGTAAHRQKFDMLLSPTGLRFSFRLSLEGVEPEAEQAWTGLLELLAPGSALLRLGAHTTSGLGLFSVQRRYWRVFDLADPRDFRDYTQLSERLDASLPGFQEERAQASPPPGEQEHCIAFQLDAETPWLTRDPREVPEGEADEQPLHEERVYWKDDRGGVRESYVLPGSAIRGALAHRLAFHHRRLAGLWADTPAGQALLDRPEDARERDPAVAYWLGEALEHDAPDGPRGRRSRLVIEEARIFVGKQSRKQPHLRIDPFTGGAWQGALYSDQPLEAQDRLDFCIHLPRELDDGSATREELLLYCRALEATFEDLASGRLSLGGAEGRGYGRFLGELDWPESWRTLISSLDNGRTA